MRKFPLGSLYLTPGVSDEFLRAKDAPFTYLARHVQGDWGDLCDDDKAENELAVREGYRILSAYKLATGVKFWVITEADRSSTTVLLPSEY